MSLNIKYQNVLTMQQTRPRSGLVGATDKCKAVKTKQNSFVYFLFVPNTLVSAKNPILYKIDEGFRILGIFNSDLLRLLRRLL